MLQIADQAQPWLVLNAKSASSNFVVLSWFMWIFIFPVWIAILIPLYIFVPRSWLVWRWPVCTALSALAGVIIFSCVVGFP